MKTTATYRYLSITRLDQLDHPISDTQGDVTRKLVESMVAEDQPYVLEVALTLDTLEEITELWLCLTYFLEQILGDNDPDQFTDAVSKVLHSAYVTGGSTTRYNGGIVAVDWVAFACRFDESPVAWSVRASVCASSSNVSSEAYVEEAFLSKY